MPKLTVYLTLLIALSVIQSSAIAQDKNPITEKTLSKLNKNAEEYNDKIDKQTKKYLKKLEKQERKFAKKFAKLDSTAAKQLLDNTKAKYEALTNKVTGATDKAKQTITQYIPTLDSTSTALKFITDNPLVQQTKQYTDKAKQALSQYEELQNKLQSATNVKQLIKERRQELNQLAQKHNLTKHLGKYNKQAYYYQAQINEYREALKDPQKAEQLIVKALQKIPSFKTFFQQFSQIGQLFPMPANGTLNMASLAGLQTRAQVMGQMQNLAGQMPSVGGQSSGLAQLQQNMQQAQSQLNNLRNRVQEAGGQSSDFEIPDFKPNDQKTKNFLKRFEIKTDLQTSRGQSYLPNIADLSLGLGYKLSDNKTLGVACAMKIGLGNGFNNIKFTTEGLALRSYADIKFSKKTNLWLTGGYERNYFTASPLTLLQRERGRGNEAAIAGLSKKYNIGKKRNGEMKILYNFLWRTQLGSQPFIYRTGFNF